MQMKRRLPDGSFSRSVWLLVAMNEAYRRLLQQMLQEALLAVADLVELVEVDEQEAPQCQFRVALAAEVEAVGVGEAQLRRQQDAAECRLAAALRAYQQRYGAVSVLPVHAPPVCHHAQKPPAEESPPLFPLRTGHTVGQFADAVATVPFSRAPQIVFHRVVCRDAVRA